MTSYIESSGIFSLILGVLAWFTSVPVIVPVIGLALGINAIFKERKLSKRRAYLQTPKNPLKRGRSSTKSHF